MKNDCKAVIITVNFRHDECALRFLRSASQLEGFRDCHLIIVDNNSDDDSVARIRRASSEFSNVELLTSPQNGGYFGAANWALQLYLKRHRESHDAPDWVVVCNNDIEFDDPRFLLRLLEKNPAGAGVIAPSIISGLTGHDANPSIGRRPSRLRMWRYRFWLSHYYLAWFQQWLSPAVRRVRHKFHQRSISSNGISSKGWGSGPVSVYAPHGAFLIFSRRFFDAGGFIDDGAFLYAEEFRVAEMCRYLGLPVIHDPELRVWHAEGQSTGRMLTRSVYQHQKNGFHYALSRYKNSYPELGPGMSARAMPTRAMTARETSTPNSNMHKAAATAADRQPVPATGEHAR